MPFWNMADHGIDVHGTDVQGTDVHGTDVIAAFLIGGLDASARLNCMAHRLHTCFSSIWLQACSSHPELQDHKNNV